MGSDCIVFAINIFTQFFAKKNPLFQIPIPMETLVHRFFEMSGVPSVYSPKADLKKVLSNSTTSGLRDALNSFYLGVT